MNLNIKSFSLTTGIILGVGLFIGTWVAIILKLDIYALQVYAKLLPGYAVTPVGSIVGLIYGFVKGAVAACIFAWLYNLLNGSAGKK